VILVKHPDSIEPILESNYEKIEQRNAESLQISFDSYKFEQNFGDFLLSPNVTLEDEDGHEYKIKQITNYPNFSRITATHIFYELGGIIKNRSITTRSDLNGVASFLFANTGWSFINIDVNDIVSLTDFGNNNVVSLISQITSLYNCEFKINPNRTITFARNIGRKLDKQYRLGLNISEISRTIDVTNVKTVITANGANGLTYTYVSPLASNPLFGRLEAPTVKDDRITNIDDLRQLAINSIKESPEVNIECSVIDIDGEVGDFVYVIHEGLNVDIETRILSKVSRRDYGSSTIELGNTPKRTIEDVLIDQRQTFVENTERTNNVIEQLDNETKEELARLDVSDNEIKLSVRNSEDTLRSEISITATQIRSEVTDLENNLNSTITQTASNIQLQVNDSNNRIATLDVRADRIQSNVVNLENQTNSSITQLSNNINLKVDVGGTISDINLSPGNATINADRIDLNGAVFVNGSITGNTDIVVANNAAVGNALYFGGTRSSFDFIEISGGDMTFNSFGDFMFSGGDLYINGRRALTVDDLL